MLAEILASNKFINHLPHCQSCIQFCFNLNQVSLPAFFQSYICDLQEIRRETRCYKSLNPSFTLQGLSTKRKDAPA